MNNFKFKTRDGIYDAKLTGDKYAISWKTYYGKEKNLNYPMSLVKKYIDSGLWIIIEEGEFEND